MKKIYIYINKRSDGYYWADINATFPDARGRGWGSRKAALADAKDNLYSNFEMIGQERPQIIVKS
jgi:hypothetical protein